MDGKCPIVRWDAVMISSDLVWELAGLLIMRGVVMNSKHAISNYQMSILL